MSMPHASRRCKYCPLCKCSRKYPFCRAPRCHSIQRHPEHIRRSSSAGIYQGSKPSACHTCSSFRWPAHSGPAPTAQATRNIRTKRQVEYWIIKKLDNFITEPVNYKLLSLLFTLSVCKRNMTCQSLLTTTSNHFPNRSTAPSHIILQLPTTRVDAVLGLNSSTRPT